jgi:hypothetical protein
MDLIAQNKFDAIVADALDDSLSHAITAGNVELLSNSCAESPSQMGGMRAD